MHLIRKLDSLCCFKHCVKFYIILSRLYGQNGPGSVNRGFSEDFPGGSDGKESTYNAGDLSLIPGLGKSPGEGNGNPLQYSCLDNSMDRGAWWATVYGVAKRQT